MPSKNEMAATMTRADAMRSGVETFTDGREVSTKITGNMRKLYGFTRKQLPANMPRDPRTYVYSLAMGDIVNLGPGFPQFVVFGCPEGELHGEPTVLDALYFQEEAQVDKTEFNPHTGEQMADAIMRMGAGMNAAWDRRKSGWFVSKTNPPSSEEVQRAIVIYTNECKRLLAEGQSYASNNRLLEINETHRRAAQYLKQKVDWDRAVSKMVDCVACGEPIKAGAVIHATTYCGAVQPGRWPDAILHGIKKIREAPKDVQEALGYDEEAERQAMTPAVPPSAIVDNSFEAGTTLNKGGKRQ